MIERDRTVRYNKCTNTYKDYPITWDNIQQFQIFFLEAQYKLSEADLWAMEFDKETFADGHKRNSRLAEIQNHRKLAIEEIKESYRVVWALRYQIYQLYKLSPDYKAAIDEQCKDDVALWINTFAWTYDPRLTNIGIPAKLPFVLFPGQVETIQRVEHNYQNNKHMMIEKSRAEGLTEMLCAYDVHHFLYHKGYKAGWGSRVRDMVDKSNSQDTIFEKIRRILYATPPNMRPKAMYSEGNKWDNNMRIANPDNGSSIIGEGGDNIGRGGRSSFYKVDEKAFIDHQGLADQALSQNTNVQLDLSTPNGLNEFYQKREAGNVDVITVWWWMNPSKNAQWRERKRPEYSAWYRLQELKIGDEAIIAREIDISYKASISGTMILPQWVQAAVDFNLPASGDCVAGFDIAAGGVDKSVYVSGFGSVVSKIKHLPQKTPLEATWAAADEGEKDRIKCLTYDKNTLGEDVHPLLMNSDRKVSFRIEGVYGQSSASETFLEEEGIRAVDKFRNRRAELWWNIRKRFEKTFLHKNNIKYFPVEEMISIPSHVGLIEELSNPLMLHNDQGKIGIESKKAMKARGIPSPNYADALAYMFANSKSHYVADSFNYWSSETIRKIELNPGAADEILISLFLTDANVVIMLIEQFLYASESINILKEFTFERVSVADIKNSVTSVVGNYTRPKYWIGNEKFFEGLTDGKATLWYDFKKAGMPLKQNFRSDRAKSFQLMDDLFHRKKLHIDEECQTLINQVRNWTIKSGEPRDDLYYAETLLQSIQLLKKHGHIKERIIPEKKGYTR